jgi:cytosine/adenosine deaminase-related metal-dependent hydrolase
MITFSGNGRLAPPNGPEPAWTDGSAELDRRRHMISPLLCPLAIQAATIRNAEMLRLEKSIGTVATGFEADLIVVEKNPLDIITTVQDPLLVISQRTHRAGPARFRPERGRA